MVKITEITYSLGRTIQMEAYSPVNFHASVKAEVNEKEVKKGFKELKKIVKEQINEDIKAVREKKAEAENKAKYPYGQCSTCGSPLAKSKKGDLYCPNSFKNTSNNPHKAKTELPPKEKEFSNNLK